MMRLLGGIGLLLLLSLITAKNVLDMGKLKDNSKELKRHPSEQDKRDENDKVVSTRQYLDKRTPKKVMSGTIFEGVDYSLKDKRSEQRPFQMDKVDGHEIVLLSLLTQIRSVSIFSGYLRDLLHLSSIMEDPSKYTIVIAPSDDAIINKLNGLKPWEFPYKLHDNENDDKLVEKNVQNFMLAHIVEYLRFSKDGKRELQGSTFNQENITITYTAKEGYVINFCGRTIPVVSIKEVINGNILIIDDVLVKPKTVGGIV